MDIHLYATHRVVPAHLVARTALDPICDQEAELFGKHGVQALVEDIVLESKVCWVLLHVLGVLLRIKPRCIWGCLLEVNHQVEMPKQSDGVLRLIQGEAILEHGVHVQDGFLLLQLESVDALGIHAHKQRTKTICEWLSERNLEFFLGEVQFKVLDLNDHLQYGLQRIVRASVEHAHDAQVLKVAGEDLLFTEVHFSDDLFSIVQEVSLVFVDQEVQREGVV